MNDTVFTSGKVAVVTGAALGIGRAACAEFARRGMNVCMIDLASEDFDESVANVQSMAASTLEVLPIAVDVSDFAALKDAQAKVRTTFGKLDFLMNNAVTRVGRGMWADMDDWHRAVDVNLWGVIYGVRAFTPMMIEGGARASIVNVGSKQGITNPPGNPVYNLCKAAVKSFSEGLEHELRNTEGADVHVHLLIPGWTTTGKSEHKPGAWLPEQVVEFMIPAVERGDFYIVCPDGETSEEMDKRRIQWAAGDITENRPALSRWQGDYTEAFTAFEKSSD